MCACADAQPVPEPKPPQASGDCALAEGAPLRLAARSVLHDDAQPEPLTLEAGRLRVRSVLHLYAPDEARFGGLSGAMIEGDCLSLIGDRGLLVRAAMQFDSAGDLAALHDASMLPLQSTGAIDTESITRSDDGALITAMETPPRLGRIAGDRVEIDVPFERVPPAIRAQPGNETLESVTNGGDGRLILLSESPQDEGISHPGWFIGADGRQGTFTYLAAPGFRPTGLARLGTQIYVLERGLALLGGWFARLSVFDVSEVADGATVRPAELGRLYAPLPMDNFEGLAARLDGAGHAHLFLVADDNFFAVQRSLLMHVSVEPAAARDHAMR